MVEGLAAKSLPPARIAAFHNIVDPYAVAPIRDALRGRG
jgi:hypothetical protein